MAIVMVIDDDSVIRTLLRRILEKDGHEVIDASNGEIAVSLFAERPADLVITDILMEGMDGCKTISELTRNRPDLKCIAISGGAQMGPFTYLMMAKTCGAMRVLKKPFHPNEILALVQEVLEGPFHASLCTQSYDNHSRIKKSILVVDPDPGHSWRVCDGLSDFGHNVIDTRNGEHAFEIIKYKQFQVAIVDVLSSKFDGTDLFQRLHEFGNRVLTIAMADFSSISVRNAVMNRGADHFVGKPLDIHYILELISPPAGFSGRVQGVDILEYLQFLLLSGKRMLLEIRPSLGNPCEVYLDEGKILHAVCGELQGTEAFYRGICAEGGEFANLPWIAPDKVEHKSSW